MSALAQAFLSFAYPPSQIPTRRATGNVPRDDTTAEAGTGIGETAIGMESVDTAAVVATTVTTDTEEEIEGTDTKVLQGIPMAITDPAPCDLLVVMSLNTLREICGIDDGMTGI